MTLRSRDFKSLASAIPPPGRWTALSRRRPLYYGGGGGQIASGIPHGHRIQDMLGFARTSPMRKK